MTRADELIAKAERREALIGVVGLGYVGLPLAVEMVKAGYRVLGFDVNPEVVAGLERGESHVRDVTHEELREVTADGRLRATTVRRVCRSRSHRRREGGGRSRRCVSSGSGRGAAASRLRTAIVRSSAIAAKARRYDVRRTRTTE